MDGFVGQLQNSEIPPHKLCFLPQLNRVELMWSRPHAI